MKHILISIFALISVASVSAALHVDKKDDKYGYVDDAGKVVIKHQYSQALPFADGMAKVQKSGKWGYVDEKGKPVIKVEFDDIAEFNNRGVAHVTKGDKHGYVRSDGTFLIKPEWNFIGSINDEGYVWVAKGKNLSDALKGLYKDDVLVVKPNYKSLGFHQTTDSADYADGHPFSSDEANEIKSNLCKLSTSEVPYIWVLQNNGLRAILDLDGKTVVKPLSGAIGAPVSDISITRAYNEKKNTYAYNYMRADGTNKKLFKKDVVVDCDGGEGCWHFYRGTALNIVNGHGYLIDREGQRVSSQYEEVIPLDINSFIVMKRGRYGIMDHSGNEVVDCAYGKINLPRPGSTYVGAQDAKSGLFGLIDFKGNVVLPFKYQNVHGESFNHVGVETEDGWGFVSLEEKELVKPRWESVFYPSSESDKYIWVQDKNDKKWHCLEVKSQKLKFDYAFDNVCVGFNDKGVAVIGQGEKFGAVDDCGKVIIPMRFSSVQLVGEAIDFINEQDRSMMGETEAYRFNLYHNPARHKYRLHQNIEEDMWDY